MIIGSNLSKAFSGEPLFEKVEFKLGNNIKAALVGRNGCGKSTLFKIISGELSPDTGNVITEGENIGYIPQEWIFPNMMVGEYLERKLEYSWDSYKIKKLLSELQFENYDEYQELATLSEGQKMKIKLLDVLLSDPTTLLIDEPTNHLDIEGILWFEKYIKNLDKNVLMISHDREFLNNTVDEIWEIDRNILSRFVGNYDFYQGEKLKLIGKWNEEYVRFLKKKSQLETLLENVRKIKDGKKRGRAVSSVKKRIEREVISNEKEKYEVKKMKELDFKSGITHSKLMIRFDRVKKKYSGNLIFENLSFDVRGGEKIWLFGPNGAGKSTIMKLIMGDINANEGNVKIGENIRVGYYAQKQENFDDKKDLLTYYLDETGHYYGEAFGNLKRFMFEKEELSKRVCDLSPGQRARYFFAIFAAKDYDMLILDEPDNHLDIDTKQVLENSLKEYKGTLILVSHDRYFIEKAGITKMLNLKDKMLTEYVS